MQLEKGDHRLKRIDRLGHLLDDSIRLPIIGYRIGWDAILGLVPGIGDVAGLALSAYLVVEAARFRLPKATLARMVGNIGLEALVGAIPFLGDLFDATFKANLRNLDLLRAHLGEVPARQRAADRRVVLGVGLAVAAVVVVLVVVIAVVVGAVWELLGL